MGGFSENEEALIRISWEELMQNFPHISLRFFTSIVEIAPEAKDMFSFLRDADEIPQNNPLLRGHAMKVFKLTYESAMQLREKGEVVVEDTLLKYLSSVHIKNGILDTHFEVLKEALLKTIKEAMGDRWSEDVNRVWAAAYDGLATAVKQEMKESIDGVLQIL
ncbi:non-symbiotic hemoglobin 2-like [Prosopis cineraria]|uniref:non-symbiotic hemoglobin 2-like n=1 Tax=Prosopis cineraria TaxID=364024 RepID=UPI0024106E34|nr:non-symbiotic hemoglobin 2-like [Prosopis cineraria]